MILIHCSRKGEQAELARRLEEVKSRQEKMERKADMIEQLEAVISFGQRCGWFGA